MKDVLLKDIGLIDYARVWRYQEALHHRLINRKMILRKHPERDLKTLSHYLLFCEHNPVYTLGKSGSEDHLLLNTGQLKTDGVQFFKINRGGDITHHGPGQMVVYPILDLDEFFTDIHKYLRFLEEAVILLLADFNIISGRVDGYTGVWLDGGTPLERKICAMGIRCSRWVTMHGLALNVNNDLRYFNGIIPCGIEGKAVTSISKELGRQVDMDLIKQRFAHHIKSLFKFNYV